MEPIEIDQSLVVESLAGKLAAAQVQIAQLETALTALQQRLQPPAPVTEP